MTMIVNFEYARALQQSARETDEVYSLLNGWTPEDPDEGVLPSDVLTLIVDLMRIMDFRFDTVVEHLELAHGEAA